MKKCMISGFFLRCTIIFLIALSEYTVKEGLFVLFALGNNLDNYSQTLTVTGVF